MKNSFPKHLTAFFIKHLTLHKGLSENTIASYSDTFILFFQYCRESYSVRQEHIDFPFISKDLIIGFCNWIESERNCSVKTRNLRLTALHSFFRYVQTESPKYASICSDILAIPMKKGPKNPPQHLTDIEIKMLLAEPDVKKREGIRDLALLALLYDSGARISELINLSRGDLRISGKITIQVKGKGNKMRLIPVSPEAGNILKAYLKSNKIDMGQTESPLFFNRSHNHLTRPGVTYILRKYVKMAKDKNPGYFKKTVSAHIVRHSKATHLLLSGVNLIYIRDFLGHASVITTERYAKTNPEFMRKAIEESNADRMTRTEKYGTEEKRELTEFLKQYRL